MDAVNRDDRLGLKSVRGMTIHRFVWSRTGLSECLAWRDCNLGNENACSTACSMLAKAPYTYPIMPSHVHPLAWHARWGLSSPLLSCRWKRVTDN